MKKKPNIDIKGTATIIDTDILGRWGHASGPCISPPEEDFLSADVEIKIDLNQLKNLDPGFTEGFDTTVISTDLKFDTETGTLIVSLSLEGYMTIARRGGLYEKGI